MVGSEEGAVCFAGTIKRLRENAAAEPPLLRLEPPA